MELTNNNDTLLDQTQPSLTPSDHVCDENCKHGENEKNLKSIPFVELTLDLKNQLASTIKDLEAAKNDLGKGHQQVIDKCDKIRNLIEKLKIDSSVKINDEAFHKFNESFLKYNTLSQFYIEEINFYINYYTKFLGADHPAEIKVDKNSKLTFHEHVANISKSLKNFIRKRKKDLSILFSQYDHGFNLQLRQLEAVSSYLVSNAAKEESKK
ncbi:TPA: hypothetical protein DEO28_01845 [Candidatus Dependentiae bacterium]|nr:MAG: hypothetical protein UR14_C0004G0058 [candidate division TM6 bacterium GW2011_GWE2_31_21]KKP52977.1 MAG: hypothetical protein UR43_C0008G0059 [candidate division TM6 bacterium GW2011_GWF2_33_332]HBS47786.1 hypothetical protein [Candidatus Dependentiae bacterium]HBZ73238.1 hypothetical protein [Candidatus Dependentiae bacterium]